ncbi:phosphoenolpyruvate carboxykinase [GTP], mitochondrial-like [Anas acuta]|uniref:phosphoenolpyruvate carboxykinase [GTP], mitochondrial-like n=1 Tax=Anas acuta TaxID=28680 RepID=UPI0035C8B3E4
MHPNFPKTPQKAKAVVQLTDSPYVVASMRIMTCVGHQIFPSRPPGTSSAASTPSAGPCPCENPLSTGGPATPRRTLVAHVPAERRIASFSSGYRGNSLLGKKCFALHIASRMARDEGWLAEHMLILGVTSPSGRKRYMSAAFPSACGKTNLAMMTPALPGWRIHCVGDDIAWMKFDAEGHLRAINTERGFFRVALGTSAKTNPNAMATIACNTIFTNVGHTSDSGVYWEVLDQSLPSGVTLTSWLGQLWSPGDTQPCAHPNSCFCTPAHQCSSAAMAGGAWGARWRLPRAVPCSPAISRGHPPCWLSVLFTSAQL